MDHFRSIKYPRGEPFLLKYYDPKLKQFVFNGKQLVAGEKRSLDETEGIIFIY